MVTAIAHCDFVHVGELAYFLKLEEKVHARPNRVLPGDLERSDRILGSECWRQVLGESVEKKLEFWKNTSRCVKRKGFSWQIRRKLRKGKGF